jgi:hypothetical protein
MYIQETTMQRGREHGVAVVGRSARGTHKHPTRQHTSNMSRSSILAVGLGGTTRRQLGLLGVSTGAATTL